MNQSGPSLTEAPDRELLTQRYANQIVGTLGCWDRVIITGTLIDVCHACAEEARLRRDDIRCFDLKIFAEPPLPVPPAHRDGPLARKPQV